MRIFLLKRIPMLGLVFAVTGGLAIAQSTQCTTFGSPGGDIPDFGSGAIALPVPFTGSSTITDVDVGLSITHTWQGDLIIEITDPDPGCGFTVPLLTRAGDSDGLGSGFSADNLGSLGVADFVLDDEAANAYDLNTKWGTVADPGINDVSGSWIPYGSFPGGGIGGLNAFDGCDPDGDWTVDISDNAGGDTGTVNEICLIITEGLLPVELTSFDGALDGDVAVLTWATASETNNAGFEIEKGIGEGAFTVIGFVGGAGTTTDVQEYSFFVEDLELGTHSFRLKQIDFDGAFEYSDVVEVSRELAEDFALQPFYPNPFNPQGTLTVMVARDQVVNIEVYDILGRFVTTLHSGRLAAQQWYTIPFRAADDLPSGTYIIQARGTYFVATQKVMLAK